MIYPSPFEEERNLKYDGILKKANEIWDEFTTGGKHGRKKVEEPKPDTMKPKKRNKALDDKIRAKREQAAKEKKEA